MYMFDYCPWTTLSWKRYTVIIISANDSDVWFFIQDDMECDISCYNSALIFGWNFVPALKALNSTKDLFCFSATWLALTFKHYEIQSPQVYFEEVKYLKRMVNQILSPFNLYRECMSSLRSEMGNIFHWIFFSHFFMNKYRIFFFNVGKSETGRCLSWLSSQLWRFHTSNTGHWA